MANYFDDFRNRVKRLLKKQKEREAAQEKKKQETKKPEIPPIPVIIPQIIQQEVIIQSKPIDTVKFLPNEKRLPPPYDVNEFKNLLETVYRSAGTNEKKAKTYEIVLESALATTKPLLELYSLIPQIWSGSSSAISDFQKIIDQSSKSLGFRPERIIPTKEYSIQKLRSMSDRLGGSAGFSPCGPLFFIKPDVIHKLHETIYFTSNRNQRFSQNSMAIVNQLWKNTQILDSLNILANSNKTAVFPELFRYMDGISESFKLEQNIRKIEEQRIKSNGGDLGQINPVGEETWFPPEPGFPFPPMGPTGGPGMPNFPMDCQPLREYCQDVLSGPSRVYRGEMPVSVTSSGIRKISSTAVCKGNQVIIEGSGFGNTPGNRGVVFGTTEVAIVSWSDNKIIVLAPDINQGAVCVGILDRDKEKRRKEIHKINQKAFGELVNAAGPCLSLPGRISDLPYKQDSPPCTGVNQIAVGKPVIRLFNINNSNKTTVKTGSDLIMKWSVENADSIRFSVRTNSIDPAPNNFPTGPPSFGSHSLGILIDRKAVIHTYKIEAKNSCGASEATVEVLVTSPKLNILGIEAIQAIQSFDWDNPNEKNSVFLVSNKLTMVRVYPKSERIFDFDPNSLENIEARLTVKFSDGKFNTYLSSHDPSTIFTVGPKSNLNREKLAQSFNFILSSDKLDGIIELTAEIFINSIKGVENYVKSSTSVTFKKTKKLKLALILVNDTINGFPAPTQQDFLETLKLGKGRIPIGDTDFLLYVPPNHLEIQTTSWIYLVPGFGFIKYSEDLKTRKGWENLLNRVDDIADDYAMSEELIWVGLVPNPNPNIYRWSGLATTGIISGWFDKHRRMLSQSGRHGTFVHELSHTLNIDHAASVNIATNLNVHSCENPEEFDSTMISTIEDVGIDVLGYKSNLNSPHVLPKGVPSLMTYCYPKINGTYFSREYSWVSIDLWNRLRNNF